MKKLYEGIFSLNRNQCRFPMEDKEGSEFFCGKRVVPGKPYCKEHCKVAYWQYTKRQEGLVFRPKKNKLKKPAK